MKSIDIGNRPVGKGSPVFVIGEVAHAHEGSAEKMMTIIKGVGKSGADAIKFQMLVPDELVVRNDSRNASFKRMVFSDSQWKDFFKYARSFGLLILGEPFDEQSLDKLSKLGVDAYKIHSTDTCNPYMLEKIAKKKKTILLATSGSTIDEVTNAIDTIKTNGNSQIILVHGYQNFPTKLEDSNLNMIRFFEEKFGLPVGYHDHVDADSEASSVLPILAIGIGAVLIDKHITYDRSKKGIDHESSLNPDEFKKMVSLIRQSEKGFGQNIEKTSALGSNNLSESELRYRKMFKKNIVIRNFVKKGQQISLADLAFKRSEPGLMPNDAKKILGKKARKDMEEDYVVKLEDIE